MATVKRRAVGDVADLSGSEDMGPVLRDSLSGQVYRRIRDALKQSHFRPGQKLVLRSVASDLDVSMTPLRDAFARLVSENALVVDSRGCVCVPVISPEQHEGLWLRSGPILAQTGAKPRLPRRRHGSILTGLRVGDPALVRQGITEDIMAGWSIRQNFT